MTTDNTTKTFQEALKTEFKRFGLKKKHEGLYLRLQEKKLIVDQFQVDYGFMGKIKFAEVVGQSDPVWDELKVLASLQGTERATLMPGYDENGVNPVFFLPGTPENLVNRAKKLEETISRKREIEMEGNRGERK